MQIIIKFVHGVIKPANKMIAIKNINTPAHHESFFTASLIEAIDDFAVAICYTTCVTCRFYLPQSYFFPLQIILLALVFFQNRFQFVTEACDEVGVDFCLDYAADFKCAVEAVRGLYFADKRQVSQAVQ